MTATALSDGTAKPIPIEPPDGDMIALTPVCSHALYTRPFVISAGDVVTIQSDEASPSPAVVYADGKAVVELKQNEKVEIAKSEYAATIIKTNDLGFYDILRQKMLLNDV